MLDVSIVSQIVSTAVAEGFDHITNIKDIVAQVKLIVMMLLFLGIVLEVAFNSVQIEIDRYLKQPALHGENTTMSSAYRR